MLSEHSDETLMLRYCEGELAAFKELYRRHCQGLFRFIAWRLPREEWAEEVAQETWIALHHARATYQPQAKFRTFLYQIARNRLVDQLRLHSPVLASELGHDDDGGDRFEHLADNMREAQTVEMSLISKQQVDGLHAALRTLPSEQKEAVIMQQFNDMSLEEIAQVSEVSVETVKSRLRYAVKKLRRLLVDSGTAQEEKI
jgi:RNA polymerase sigma-70 factor (ECF subfamily)